MAILFRQLRLYVIVVTAFTIILIFSGMRILFKTLEGALEEVNEQKPDDFSVTVHLSTYSVIKLDNFLLPPHPKQGHPNPDRKFSEARQDETVYKIFPKIGGFFIELGANDGLYLSNTIWLERQHGWTGLLIEANPGLCKHIDDLKRHAWRLCSCISKKMRHATFVRADSIGGVEENLDIYHKKHFNVTRKVEVPCFSMSEVLDRINVHHIDYYSLDVEGAEISILESMKEELSSGKMTVDIWSIEYRVWDGEQTLVQKSMENLKVIRNFFGEVGGYVEHSHLSENRNNAIGYALDVMFVNFKTWCKHYPNLPNGGTCMVAQTIMAIILRQRQRYIIAATAVTSLLLFWIYVLLKEPEEINEQKPDDFSVTINLNAYPVIKLDDFLRPPHPKQGHSNPDRKFSQAGQDEAVYKIFPKSLGFFVDIGANDGLYLSNTIWLERKHWWTGLLIEANPGLCKHIDDLKRHAWRLCACISNKVRRATFVRADGVGGVEGNLDTDHKKQFNVTRKVEVPCFSMAEVLDKINVHHIDFYSLDVEGAEMVILESVREELSSGKMTVDVWSIEYRVWDGKQIVVQKSMENLKALRKFFREVGGYVEHSHLSNDKNNAIGYALDVIFVNVKTWCKHYPILPNGEPC
ncbi:uncharacterized protein LOC133179224 [Saccostrea echinata]|uniref:uncharacterized protein LOC133179224 n=1 Tax=Saccostrea echinata TaxID=191078 RepID=UPI002A807E53|nr:uncharacterized protein LOC133179224 [Saccostrea echinata]